MSPHSLGKQIDWKLKTKQIGADTVFCPHSLGKQIDWKRWKQRLNFFCYFLSGFETYFYCLKVRTSDLQIDAILKLMFRI